MYIVKYTYDKLTWIEVEVDASSPTDAVQQCREAHEGCTAKYVRYEK